MPSVEWLESPTVGDLEPVADLFNRWSAEVIPGERPMPVVELDAMLNRGPAHQDARLAVVAEGDGIAGAAALVTQDLEGRRNDAYIDFLVTSPEARRRGVARALLEAVVVRAREANRSRLTGSSVAGDGAADAFARSCNAQPELLELQNRASTSEMDGEMLRGWVERSQDRAKEYSLIRADGVLPDDLQDGYAALASVMNTAPHGPNLEDLVLSGADVLELQRAYEDHGFRRWTVIARHDPSGDLAGFTELMISPFRPWIAFQWDTGVDPKHRNLGLGRWLKAANALRLLEERPEVELIETWNAASNASMLGINRAMGFRTVAEWQSWEMPI